MDQHLISDLITRYKAHIEVGGLTDEAYKWQLAARQQGMPDVHAADFGASVQALRFQNLVYYNAPVVLKVLANNRPEDLRALFRGLFDTAQPLEARLRAFGEGSLQLYRAIEPENTLGHHQDERSMATYLALYDADHYPLYKNTVYVDLCKYLGIVHHTKKYAAYPHYIALLEELIANHLKPDVALQALVRAHLPTDAHPDSGLYLLAQDIVYFLYTERHRQLPAEGAAHFLVSVHMGGATKGELEDRSTEMLRRGCWHFNPNYDNEQTHSQQLLTTKLKPGDKLALKRAYEQDKQVHIALVATGTVTDVEEQQGDDWYECSVDWQPLAPAPVLAFGTSKRFYKRFIIRLIDPKDIATFFSNTTQPPWRKPLPPCPSTSFSTARLARAKPTTSPAN